MIYSGFLLALISNFIPVAAVQAVGGVLLLVLLVMAYIWRSGAVDGGYRHTHMCYLIRSFWIGSLFLVVGIVLAVLLADHSLIQGAVDGIAAGAYLEEEQINNILMQYTVDNLVVFALTLLPSLAYLAYRFLKGMVIANKEEPVTNIKSWL